MKEMFVNNIFIINNDHSCEELKFNRAATRMRQVVDLIMYLYMLHVCAFNTESATQGKANCARQLAVLKGNKTLLQ